MPRGNGGIIGPANIPTQSSAKGVWSLSELTLAVRQSIWPLGNLGSDPYFEYTTLLLPGNGTNGAQNNTFLDGSTNNFTITRNGNTTQGTFSPFSQTGWGNYFDGSGDSLTYTTPSTVVREWWVNDFTVEAWVYPTTLTGWSYFTTVTIPTLIGNASTTTATNYWSFGPIDTGVVRLHYFNGSVNVVVSSTETVNINQWNHIAFTKTSSGVSIFVNGVGATAVAISGTPQSSNAVPLTIGQANNTSVNGYISNARIVNGTAVYSGTTYTVPTAPLTAITNTSLLTCQSNRFIDNSTNNFTITKNGDTRVVAFSPFNPTASWSAATYGGSGYFDGNSDYLRTTGSALAVGSGTFTYEAWVFPTSLAASISGIFDSRIYTGSAGTNGIGLFLTSGGEVRIDNSAGAILTTSGAAITVNSWFHIAAEKSAGNLIIYVNGVSKGSVANSATYSSTEISIGTSFSNAWPLTGYISSFRLVTSAVYGGNFTPPTSPPTAITNTSLLLNFTNAGIYDATSKNDLETVGNAQLSTAQYKFPPSSMAFDGNGDYLFTPSSADFVFNGDFTIEFWVYRAGSSAGGTGNYEALVATYNGSTGYGVWWLNTTNVLHTRVEGTTADTTTALSNSTWYHVAITRSGSTVRTFVNGVQGSSLTSSATAANPGLYIGAQTVNKNFNGYIQDLRITKGYARYTADFTPPTAAFPTL